MLSERLLPSVAKAAETAHRAYQALLPTNDAPALNALILETGHFEHGQNDGPIDTMGIGGYRRGY